MARPRRALIVEDAERDAARITHELRRGGHELVCERVETEAAMRAALASASGTSSSAW